jgi:hypothetical protein
MKVELQGKVTDQVSSGDIGSDLPRLNLDRYVDYPVSWFSSVLLREYRDSTLKRAATTSFHVVPNSSFINHPTYQLTNLLHGAESSLRNRQSLSY